MKRERERERDAWEAAQQCLVNLTSVSISEHPPKWCSWAAAARQLAESWPRTGGGSPRGYWPRYLPGRDSAGQICCVLSVLSYLLDARCQMPLTAHGEIKKISNRPASRQSHLPPTVPKSCTQPSPTQLQRRPRAAAGSSAGCERKYSTREAEAAQARILGEPEQHRANYEQGKSPCISLLSTTHRTDTPATTPNADRHNNDSATLLPHVGARTISQGRTPGTLQTHQTRRAAGPFLCPPQRRLASRLSYLPPTVPRSFPASPNATATAAAGSSRLLRKAERQDERQTHFYALLSVAWHPA